MRMARGGNPPCRSEFGAAHHSRGSFRCKADRVGRTSRRHQRGAGGRVRGPGRRARVSRRWARISARKARIPAVWQPVFSALRLPRGAPRLFGLRGHRSRASGSGIREHRGGGAGKIFEFNSPSGAPANSTMRRWRLSPRATRASSCRGLALGAQQAHGRLHRLELRRRCSRRQDCGIATDRLAVARRLFSRCTTAMPLQRAGSWRRGDFRLAPCSARGWPDWRRCAWCRHSCAAFYGRFGAGG